MTLQDAMWTAKPGRLRSAQAEARNAYNRNHPLSAHSIMLSAYLTILGGKPTDQHHPLKFSFYALWHALALLRHKKELNHNQLDVLIQFLIKLRRKTSFIPTRHRLLELSEREIDLADRNDKKKPHQMALAHMTRAEVELLVGQNPKDVERSIGWALALERSIRAEVSQPQGLRQFVRVLRKAGELYGVMGDTVLRQKFLWQAFNLARGEANSPDQVEKIRHLLR